METTMTQDKRKALGRGLDSLLPAARAIAPLPGAGPGIEPTLVPNAGVQGGAPAFAPAPARDPVEGELREIELGKIESNPFQTRKQIKEADLAELAASIKANGVLEPIIVRPLRDGRFQLIAGERRTQAAARAGRQTIPAIVREVSDQTAMEMTIIENLQREDLGPMEQARAFDRLSREFGLTQEQMSVRTGKERSTISNYLRLLKLPFDVQLELEHNFKITLSHAKLLLMLNTDEEISRAAREIVSRNLSVIQTEDLIFDMKNPIAREPKPVKPVDPNVRAAQRELEASLGCRVRIKDKNGKGKIVIEYARLEDFDRVIEILGRK
jgi:ParB family chromosome partitioning protein